MKWDQIGPTELYCPALGCTLQASTYWPHYIQISQTAFPLIVPTVSSRTRGARGSGPAGEA
jgi:hypothetical protein